MRKFGAKTFDSESFLDKFVEESDFFEVQAIQSNDYSFLKKYDKKIVVHSEHSGFDVNISNLSKYEFNLKAINFAKEVADLCQAEKIVIHPGYNEGANCSLENVISFLRENFDSRFCIENVPYEAFGYVKFGSSVDEIKRIVDETGVGFCFDINHAILYSVSVGLDYWDVLKDFEELSPRHYHLCGHNLKVGKDHFNFCDGDLDIERVFEIISSDANITLEVDHLNVEEIFNDFNFVRKF